MSKPLQCRAFLLAAAALLAAVTADAQRATLQDIAWLTGHWRLEQRGETVEERWTEPAGGAMLAVARTVKDGRMTAFEFLRIVEREGTLVYIAQPDGRPAVEFRLAAVSGTSARFENPAHDFPKVITYTLQGEGSLQAVVSDGTRQLTFFFSADRRAPSRRP